MKTKTMNMFAATNEDLPIISGMHMTQAAEMPVAQPQSYRVWADSQAFWYPQSFDTLEGALTYAERWLHPTHTKRIYCNDEQVVTVLPLP